MTRSRKKAPIVSVGRRAFRAWKRSVNRILRHRAKQQLKVLTKNPEEDNIVLPVIREAGNIYDSPKDGRQRWQKQPQNPENDHVKHTFWTVEGWKKLFRK